MKKYDVAIIGGGFAGIGAALAARRSGASVIIVEKSNCFGGAATNCLVTPFMVYWAEIDNKRVDLSAGIFKEIHERLEKRNAIQGVGFLEEELKYVLNEMVLEENIDVLFHSYIFKADVSENKITSVSIATREGEMKLEAKTFIDATGDGQLAYLAGCPFTLGREPDHLCQPMTLCFRVGNADTERFMKSRDRFQKAYKESLENGEFINPRENVLVFTTPQKNVLHFNSTRVVKKDPTVTLDVSEAELIARKQVFELYDFLKKHADGLEESYIISTAAEIGVRESRMIKGIYTLTEDDCRKCTKFKDSIAACNYEIDIHNPEGTGTYLYSFPKGEYYTIPYGTLVPESIDNMLVAGRCISCEHGAQASLRIMPTVCTLGEAAGTAIGISLKDNVLPKDVDVKKLQATLKKNGAFIGI